MIVFSALVSSSRIALRRTLTSLMFFRTLVLLRLTNKQISPPEADIVARAPAEM
jgi:hypothetical protein